MNLVKKWFFLVVLSTLLEFMKAVNEESVCPAGHYLIVDEKGLQKCHSCPNCPPGFGLEPRCGSTLNKTESPGFDCKLCVRGKTYSEEHGPGSCKGCVICTPKEVVWNKCTEEKNANCSGTCVKNYYFDSHTHDCQPCSYCCGDKKDVIVKECVDHGMPKHRRCNMHQALKCTSTTITPITIGPTTNTSCVKNYYFDSHTHDCQQCSYCCGDKNDVIVKECVDHGMPKHRRCNILRRLQCTPQNATPTPIQHERNEPNDLNVILGGSLTVTAIVILTIIMLYRIRKNIIAEDTYNIRSSRSSIKKQYNSLSSPEKQHFLKVLNSSFKEQYDLLSSSEKQLFLENAMTDLRAEQARKTTQEQGGLTTDDEQVKAESDVETENHRKVQNTSSKEQYDLLPPSEKQLFPKSSRRRSERSKRSESLKRSREHYDYLQVAITAVHAKQARETTQEQDFVRNYTTQDV